MRFRDSQRCSCGKRWELRPALIDRFGMPACARCGHRGLPSVRFTADLSAWNWSAIADGLQKAGGTGATGGSETKAWMRTNTNGEFSPVALGRRQD